MASIETTQPRCSRRFLTVVVALVAVLVLAACGGPDAAKRAARAELMSDADMDSLGLDEFMDLPRPERDVRRQRARTWRDHAAAAEDAWTRAGVLETAAGLAPDDPHVWLDLAETARWLGDQLLVDRALSRATAALRHLNEPESDLRVTRSERDEIVIRAAVQRAWYHYDRAEWHKGLGWARAALSTEPGAVHALVIKGLLEAGAQQRVQAGIAAEDLFRRTAFARNAMWIRAVSALAYDDRVLAFNRAVGAHAPDDRAAECFRDRGRIAEVVGEWAYARRWYADAAAALHPSAASYRRRVDHLRLDEDVAVEMPVWLGMDRYFLTGSLSAYTALVFERFRSAGSAEDRTLWGGETVNAAGILLRRDEDRPWALRARGLVFLDQGNFQRAREDLQLAERAFAEADREEPAVVAGLGRLWLREEEHKRALPYLERAVLLSPMDPEVWSDLGLAKVMARDRAGARAAFDRAIELAPGEATAWYNRGLMFLHAGDLDAAAADLGEAARLAPDNAEVGRLLQRIRVMQRDPGAAE